MKVSFTLIFFFTSLLIFAKDACPPPCNVNLGPDVTVCDNAHFTLNPHPEPAGTYTWVGSIGLSCYNCPSPKVSGLGPGVYVYIATLTMPDGCTATDTLFVSVINGTAPQYEIAQNQTICAGDSIALGGKAFAGTFYNWYSNPMGFVRDSANPKARPLVPTTYYLSVSNTSCPLPVLDSVTITPVALTLQVTPIDTTICQGRSVPIVATTNPPGQAIAWDLSASLQTSSGGAMALATPAGSTLYTATVSLNGCTRQRLVYVRVDSLPGSLHLDPAIDTICQGETVVMGSPDYDHQAFPFISFSWSPLTGAITPDGMISLTVKPNQTNQYRRITVNGVCRDTAFSKIIVIPKATMDIAPPLSEICPGDTVHFALSYTPGVGNITWSPATGLSCTTCDTPAATPPVSQTYTVSGFYLGCPVSQTARVDVKTLGALQFPAQTRLCPGLSVTLNVQADPLANYTWTSTHPGFGTVTDKTPVFLPTQTATYYVTVDNGCLRRDSVKITVLPQATLDVEGDTICKNLTTTLTAVTSIAGTIQWRNDDTGQIEGTGPTLSVSPVQTTHYSVIYTYNGADSCQIVKAITVAVKGEAPLIQFPDPPSICPGKSIKLNTGPVLSGSQYFWQANPADPSLAPFATSAYPEVTPAQNTFYSVTASKDGCSVSKQVEVTVAQGSLTVAPVLTICSGDPVMLVATGNSTPSGSYKWSTGETTASISPKPSAPTTYTVTFTYGNGCTLVKTVQVDVVPGFSLSIQSVPDTGQINVGTPVTLTAVVSPPQNLSNFTFVWEETTVDTKTLPGAGESIDVVPSSNDTSKAEVRYTLTVTSPTGCTKVVEKVFRLIFPLVRFPNAFTPDGDGHNDRFGMVVPRGLAFVDRMEIYNRWGQKIFESTDPNASWDGTVDGQNAPSDVYIYRVWWRRGDGALQMQAKGDITLLR